MTVAIKVGAIIIRTGTLIPECLHVEVEPYEPGWKLIQNADVDAVERDLRKGGWNFFFLAGQIQTAACGHRGENTVRRVIRRVLTKAKSSRFNCLEITEISAKRFLGIPYVRVSAHSRHIQKGAFLPEFAEENAISAATAWAEG